MKPTLIDTAHKLLKARPEGLTSAELATLMNHPRKLLVPTLVDLKKQGKVRSARCGEGLEHTYWAVTPYWQQNTTTTTGQPAKTDQQRAAKVLTEIESKPKPPVVFNKISLAPKPVVDLSKIIEDIADAVAKALSASLSNRIAEVVQNQVQTALDNLPAQLLPNKTSKIKVTVVGLHAGQMSMIEREFGKELDLSFVSADEGKGGRLKSLCATNDAIITMSDFISHATVDLINACGGNHVPVAGGMTHLRDTLTEIYVGEPACAN